MIKHFHIDNFKSLVDFRLSPEGGSLAPAMTKGVEFLSLFAFTNTGLSQKAT